MAMPKIEDARALSDEDLAAEIIAVKKELFELRLQKATRQLEKPHLIRHSKHRLAQLLTVEAERQQGMPPSALGAEMAEQSSQTTDQEV